MTKSSIALNFMYRVGFSFSLVVPFSGRSIERFLPITFYSTQKSQGRSIDGSYMIPKVALAENLVNVLESSCSCGTRFEVRNGSDSMGNGKINLAKDLACLVQDSCEPLEQKFKVKTRFEVKRFLEMRVKKKVKAHYREGKFHDLLTNVIADPTTLKDAYDCIRLTANVDLKVDGDNLLFESIAYDLANGNFDVGANVYSISTRGAKLNREKLTFSKLKLRVIQEAVRIVLEVVYRPHFSKISHGLRSGRSHSSALKYVCKHIPDLDWWFTLLVNQRLDDLILNKLLSSLEDKIEDFGLFSMIRSMFDAGVLNMEFGGFPKGHGLPQEGVLSPVLMNIYLDMLDREIYRISMRYETFGSKPTIEDGCHPRLRDWFRRQMKSHNTPRENVSDNSSVRVYCCRFMDEIFFAISGPKEVAVSFKSDVERYLKNSLYLGVSDQSEVMSSCDQRGIQFIGTMIKRHARETAAERAVHKLKEKIELFYDQKKEAWDEWTIRIGRKWLAHGLKKVKESEIKHLADNASILSRISSYRKSGMETDHWYKILLKVWMQYLNVRNVKNEEMIIAKHIVEPALPQELRDSYYRFQECVKEYVSSEIASTNALLLAGSSLDLVLTTKTLAPISFIKKRLRRYGLINREGYAISCHALIVLDDDQIIDWFSGIICRWLRWFRECVNFNEVKLIISNQVRMSCIRTLAEKYRMHEALIEKKFDSEMRRVPSMQEMDLDEANAELAFQESAFDGDLTYGLDHNGLCLISFARKVSQSRPCICFVIGCSAAVSSVYSLHVMERQKFPGWKTGFSSSIHPSLHRRRIGLCKHHVKDLFLGNISLQSIDFGSWR